MDKIVITRGLAMPFFPMRPAVGRVLRNKRNVQEFYDQVLRKREWVVQPKLEGDRATIGVLDGKVYIQNRHGSWYKQRVRNIEDFKNLPNKTVLDGEVFKGNFYAFECLAVDGKSVAMSTVMEREVLAFQLTKLLGHTWKFDRPSKGWIANLGDNAPEYGGVVLKRAGSPYIVMGSPDQASLDWFKRCWA
jgi:ATP-dependent DNA ligase